MEPRAGCRLPVRVEQVVNGALLVTVSCGQRSFAGILLDCTKKSPTMRAWLFSWSFRLRGCPPCPPFRPRGPACLLAGCVQNHARPAVVSLAPGFLGGAGVSGCKDRTTGAPRGLAAECIYSPGTDVRFSGCGAAGARVPLTPCGLIPPGQGCQLRATLQAPGHQLHVWVLQALAGSLCTRGADAHPPPPRSPGAWVPPGAQHRLQGPRPRDARRSPYV
uniref:PWWP domain containing 2B n=1 Tax=Myotis myotis TaxID=51298 RepID=A0A7J7TUH4_MYOMY|nr:PWWP domain containing 2B [Myotis myotis]